MDRGPCSTLRRTGMRTSTIERGQARARIGEGLRRLTPGLIQAENRAVQMANSPLPARHELRHAVSVLRSATLLTAAEAETLNTLIDFCGTWESEGVPIVFATNRRLRSRMSGVNSDRAICARLACLGRRGLICHVERPGGRRGVEIDPETGEKVYYGISLLPLVAILPEAARVETIREAEYAETTKQRRRISSLITRIEALSGTAIELGLNTTEWIARHEMALSIHKTIDTCEDLSVLRAYAEQLVEMCTNSTDTINECLRSLPNAHCEVSQDPNGEQYDGIAQDSGYPESAIHPKTINKPITDKSEHCTHRTHPTPSIPPCPSNNVSATNVRNSLENSPYSPRRILTFIQPTQDEELALPVKTQSSPVMTHAGSDMASSELIHREMQKYRISPDHLAEISEGLAAYLPYGTEDDPDWKDLAAAAFALRPIIGLSERGWSRAVRILGVDGATVAMAIATADVNRPNIRKSVAEYIAWMAKFTAGGGHVGFGPKLRSAISRTRGI